MLSRGEKMRGVHQEHAPKPLSSSRKAKREREEREATLPLPSTSPTSSTTAPDADDDLPDGLLAPPPAKKARRSRDREEEQARELPPLSPRKLAALQALPPAVPVSEELWNSDLNASTNGFF